MKIVDFVQSQIFFWMAWILIPFLMEILPAIVDFFILAHKKMMKKKQTRLKYLPEITLIIPVYNSAATLRACLESVYRSDYDKNLIYIMLVNNEGKDNSFEIFKECQKEFSELNITWMNAKQGKAKALNMALFHALGKYIIHIDSDGVLHPQALRNVVSRFERDETVDCVTGTIMTSPDMIDATKGIFKRTFLKIEFMEYCQAFLAGRMFQENFNSIYTLSGAFSAFRKSTILKTQLYNTDTVCEDTQVTFQVRDQMMKRVCICDDAFFFVDPISGLNELYTQRQRWQRGEMEVAHMFHNREKKKKTFVSSIVIRLLLFDHTFAFPRMIWYFALICLGFVNYSMNLIVQSVMVIYLLYTFAGFLFYLNITSFLQPYKELQKYYAKKWYLIFLLPVFNFVVFWCRFAGIINSIRSEQTWKTRNLSEEYAACKAVVKRDFGHAKKIIDKLRTWVNVEEE